MIRGVAYSKRLLALSAVGTGAVCAMALLHLRLTGERAEQRRRAVDLEGLLSGQIVSMSDCEDSSLEALRARVGRFRVQLGPQDTWERLLRVFGGRWKAEAGTKEDKDGYSLLSGTFVLLSPTASDWPEIVETINAAEHLPGAGIAGFEMKSSGDREHRTVGLVKIVVAVHARRSGPNP